MATHCTWEQARLGPGDTGTLHCEVMGLFGQGPGRGKVASDEHMEKSVITDLGGGHAVQRGEPCVSPDDHWTGPARKARGTR